MLGTDGISLAIKHLLEFIISGTINKTNSLHSHFENILFYRLMFTRYHFCSLRNSFLSLLLFCFEMSTFLKWRVWWWDYSVWQNVQTHLYFLWACCQTYCLQLSKKKTTAVYLATCFTSVNISHTAICMKCGERKREREKKWGGGGGGGALSPKFAHFFLLCWFYALFNCLFVWIWHEMC